MRKAEPHRGLRIVIPTICLLILLLPTDLGLSQADTSGNRDEQGAMVKAFLTFAEEEWVRILESIQIGHEHAVEMMGATKIPLSSKQMYVVLWVKERPKTYRADVVQSDSLQHPLNGTITFIVPVERGTLMVKGPRQHCRGKPLKECLQGGGRIAKRGFFNPMGGKMTVEQPTEVVLTYVLRVGRWEREDERSVLEIVNTLPSASSIR